MGTEAPVRVGLYVHLPWCLRKCPYCDFNSYEIRGDIDESAYVDVLLCDLDQELTSWTSVEVTSIFIGGGTPSLFSGRSVARLLEGIVGRLALSHDVEISLEANPGAAEILQFEDYLRAGVSRLSLGIQSFDDAKLKTLGRVHDSKDARRACRAARDAGFENLNVDIMFGLPEAISGEALLDLQEALVFVPEHLSWYQLTIEQGTAFAQNPPALPVHDLICDDYDRGLEYLVCAGFEHYEVSSYAKEGYVSRHNLNYWQFGDYIGIGAGAHGKRTTEDGFVRTTKIAHPQRYMNAARKGHAFGNEKVIQGPTRVAEFMLNALRLRCGFTLDQFEKRTGLPAGTIDQPVDDAMKYGWIEWRRGRICPTASGFRFLNELQLLFFD